MYNKFVNAKKKFVNFFNKARSIDYLNLSFSQEGEDTILRRLFAEKESGFYVDVGAHHPKRFSNTYLFYMAGWSGINIEPNPDAVTLFNSCRPRDINLQFGVASQDSILEYYKFDEPALNTFDFQVVNDRVLNTEYKLLSKISVPVRPLSSILDEYLCNQISIDFITIDVEGFDFDVLISNNWDIYRPKFVLIEMLDVEFDGLPSAPITIYMRSIGYKLFAKTYNTVFFKECSN